jgi:hypothetical protein
MESKCGQLFSKGDVMLFFESHFLVIGVGLVLIGIFY